ncbi:MAG TPA: FAD-linked oxidase C-terminal domain-containing protein [Thermoleophilia bacterium]|nr:FAD-linked oxidase C-terminal domain-containing protein [Thermoleophilia bacterium]
MIDQSVIQELKGIVGEDNVLHNKADLQTYEYDAYLEKSLPDVVVFVDSTQEVSDVVKAANRAQIPFVARGRATNLSGGVLAMRQGIVIELARMDRILDIDIENQRMIVEPAIYNLEVTGAIDNLGYYYAPDPASGKACSIGGNVGENAGGPHCFKYGVTSNHVLGMEVVLPDGEITWLGGKALDTPGLDLTGVFVGSEGTLGIATKLVLRILHKPEAVKTMLAVYDSIDDASSSVSAIVSHKMVPATLEMMDNLVIQAIEQSMAAGFPLDAAAVLLIELDGLKDGMEEMADKIVEICKENNVREIKVATCEAERAALWKGRKGAFGAIARLSPNYLVADGTVPRTKLPETLRLCREIGDKYGLRVANVFHAGDGNLHPLILFDSRNSEDKKKVLKAGMEMLQVCADMGGTVSGEHGVGIEKAEAMHMVYNEKDLLAQEWVKDAWDPQDLANPGKILPQRLIKREEAHVS